MRLNVHGPELQGEAPRSSPPNSLQTADRALQILLMFDDAHQEWGVTGIAREFGITKSMAHRLLATLTGRGFLMSDPDTHRYRLGPSTLTMGQMWERCGSIQLLVNPILRELSARTGASTVLALPDHFHMRTVAAVDGTSGPLRIQPLIGELYPAHAGATSKAYYAYLPVSQRRQLLQGQPVARFTDRTVTDPGALEDEFLAIRERGYAMTMGEYDSHVSCVAVMVSVQGRPYGSLSAAGPVETFTEPERSVSALRRAAAQIESRLTRRTMQDR